VAQKLSLIFANTSFVSKPVKVLVKIFDFLKFKKIKSERRKDREESEW
jgi:hypothetical protein